MTSVILFLIFLAICIAYGYPRTISRNDVVYSASAGSSDEPHNSAGPTVFSEKSAVIKLPDGTYANTRSFHRIRINGTCMSPIDINHGDEWLAIKINPKKDLSSQIKHNDVLLIYLADTNRYKIRRVKKFIDEKTLDTYSFNPDGSEHQSSRPHKADSIMGVVKYRLSQN